MDRKSESTEDRLARLRQARDVATEFEERVGDKHESQLHKIDMSLQKAGSKVRKERFDEWLNDAMGPVAGLAIAKGMDDLVDQADELMEDVEIRTEQAD